jgi:hypothetical protein
LREPYGRILVAVVFIVMLANMPIDHTPMIEDYTVCERAPTVHVPSAEVWSDNFDDEDISDWQLFAINHTATPDTLMSSNQSVTGGVLRATGLEWDYAGHNSSVAYGTWTFDVDIQDPVNEYHFYVGIAMEQFNNGWFTRERAGGGYAIGFATPDDGQDYIYLVRGSNDEGVAFLDYYYADDLVGWKNVIVTRELDGQFYVYLDGVLILDALNTYHTSSERLYFFSHGGPAIDNITVSNTVDYDAAPPKWGHPLDDMEIALGDSFYYDFNATDNSGIDQWWINDTLNFAIDDDGTVTNIRDIVVGEYGISVGVNDTLGNTQTGTFTLTVEEGLAIFPVELMIVAIGVPAVLVVALVIWRARKK